MPTSNSQARWPEAIMITIALWVFVLLIFLPIIVDRHPDPTPLSVALDASTVFVSMALAMPMFAVFRRTVRMRAAVRTPILIGTVMLAAVANTVFDLFFQRLVAAHFEPSWAVIPTNLARAYPSALNYILVFGVNMALFQVSLSRRAQLKQELQLSRARSAAQQAQLTALRYQLNPHFLFNALNSISALIVTRRNEDAERMTDKLSSFLRTSLSADPGALVPLGDELAITEEYLDIENVRFGDRLRVDLDCTPEACEQPVPGFLVQPLVENAIKHGVAESRETIEVRIGAFIAANELCIRVENDLPPGDGFVNVVNDRPRSGLGLANVRRRLETTYGKAAALKTERRDNRFIATICIPATHRTN